MDYAQAGCMVETEQEEFAPRGAWNRDVPAAKETWMRGYLTSCVGLAIGLWANVAPAQDTPWRPAPAAGLSTGIKIGPLVPLAPAPEPDERDYQPASDQPAVIRAQAGPPPLPPPPPTYVAPGPAVAAGNEPYNCGQVAKPGGFFASCGDSINEWWHGIPGSVTGIFQTTPSRAPFQSDQKYNDKLISPVSNPFYFEDPRALTELRPVFIWQKTGNTNPVYAGGSNFWFGVQGRVAITERLSITMSRLGIMWSNPDTAGPVPPGEFSHSAGFGEIMVGPKLTLLRMENFVGALGFNFEIPTGSSSVFQDTGTLSLDPYLSLAYRFLDGAKYGGLLFQTTDGYSFSTNNQRTEFFYGSYQLAWDYRNYHVFFPLVELNWTHYTVNGRTRDIGFEGSDMFHFGSNGAAGHDDLVINFGFRYKVSEHLQFGLTAGFSLLGTGRHMDAFRMTADMIFRY
jgi:hypothetical protein